MADFENNGYIDVATRIAEFREKYPDGSLSRLDPNGNLIPVDWRQDFGVGVTSGDKDKPLSWVGVTAFAYRGPGDKNPGVGTAYERVPGLTPYTRNSEVQNAETSAWGRAIVAALAADTKVGVASLDEVKIRKAEQEAQKSVAAETTRVSPAEQKIASAKRSTGVEAKRDELQALAKAQGREWTDVVTLGDKINAPASRAAWTKDEAMLQKVIEAVKSGEA